MMPLIGWPESALYTVNTISSHRASHGELHITPTTCSAILANRPYRGEGRAATWPGASVQDNCCTRRSSSFPLTQRAARTRATPQQPWLLGCVYRPSRMVNETVSAPRARVLATNGIRQALPVHRTLLHLSLLCTALSISYRSSLTAAHPRSDGVERKCVGSMHLRISRA